VLDEATSHIPLSLTGRSGRCQWDDGSGRKVNKNNTMSGLGLTARRGRDSAGGRLPASRKLMVRVPEVLDSPDRLSVRHSGPIRPPEPSASRSRACSPPNGKTVIPW